MITIDENPLEKGKKSQIEKAFDAATNSFTKHLNPEYSDDPVTQEKKKRLDKAFDDCRKFPVGEIVNISDTDMFNIIKSVFLPYSSIESIDDVFTTLSLGSDIKKGDIERLEENKWIIKTEDVLKKIQIALSNEHRTLKRKNE